MLKEIHEQPEALRQSLAGPGHAATARSRRPRSTASRTRSGASTRVELVACGTASYAALVGRGARSRTGPGCRRGSRSARSSATRRRRSTRTTLVIAVTQSGETADTIAPTRWAREQGCPIVAVTNTVGSAITREADAVLFLQAGPGDRGRGVEDVRHPGHDADRARRGDRQGARRAGRGAGAGARPRAAGAARRRRAGPRARRRATAGPRAAVRQLARLHVHRPRLRASRRRSRARSSSRRSATSTPRAMPRAS